MTQTKSSRRHSRAGESAGAQSPAFNGEESPLSWLASRKDKDGQPLLSRQQFEAGEQLRRDYTFAMLSPRVTASWSALPGDPSGRRNAPGAGADLADNVVAARERVNRAIAAVGPELSSILIDVCCYLKGLESLEKSAGWPQRSGKIVLGLALSRLARHYGLEREDTSSSSTARARVRHWGTHDYRPALDPGEPADEGTPQ